MVAFLRRFLVVFLVLLQLVAPLVHAHVGDEGGVGGWHLHEFEQWRAANADEVLAHIHHELHAQSAVVEVGSAIKLNLPLFYADNLSHAFDTSIFGPAPLASATLVFRRLDPPPELIQPGVSLHSSRAPPC
ncbi:hypothetical protein [Methylomonas sp. LWB]|uniref:hypothetical protein n=1 Tax=Methylomonas sp. LWB TaxID=1905845 RepID=UPI0011152039|nr:hypothetical protein [Methylomonas sp. LWB]